jgi:hypothetical protein
MFMNRYVNIGLALAMAAFTGAATADLMAQAQPAKPAGGQTAKPGQDTQTAKPAPDTQKPAQDTQKPARGTQTAKPANQRQFMQEGGAVNLGTVRIPRAVKAGGESLPAGSYQVRVTEQPASPPAPGQTPQYERWAEFLRGGKVVAREVVTVVPNTDISQVAEMKPPASGSSRTDVLKGNDYLRLWVNRGGNHYLVHFPM